MNPNDISEPVKIAFDDKGKPKGYIIECEFFKLSGKWYMSENVIIPLDTKTFEFHEAIKNYRRVNGFITCGIDLRGIPFLIHNTI